MNKKLISYSDYYPYGMLLPNRHESSADYRYGFQGQEKDDEIKGEGNSINYKYRMHDPRVGRFFAVDPLTSKYPHWTPYQFDGNMPTRFIELEGLEPGYDGTTNGQVEQAAKKETKNIYNWVWNSDKSEWKQGARYTGATTQEALEISKHVYTVDKTDVDPFTKKGDVKNTEWSLIDENIKSNGFKAGTYRRTIDGVNFYTVAYAGTDDIGDVITDINQAVGLGFVLQYLYAVNYAKSQSSIYGTNLTFTGHSLGGGLASLAALKIEGSHGITFNPAALSFDTKGWFLKNPFLKGNIDAFIIKGEILNYTQFKMGLIPEGDIHEIAPLTPKPTYKNMDIPLIYELMNHEYNVSMWRINNHSINSFRSFQFKQITH